MKDYIRKYIYNDAFTPDDVLYGRTGFQYWDSLIQAERNKIIREGKKEWEATSPQERGKFIADFQALIRQRRNVDGGGKLMNASSYDILREMMTWMHPK